MICGCKTGLFEWDRTCEHVSKLSKFSRHWIHVTQDIYYLSCISCITSSSRSICVQNKVSTYFYICNVLTCLFFSSLFPLGSRHFQRGTCDVIPVHRVRTSSSCCTGRNFNRLYNCFVMFHQYVEGEQAQSYPLSSTILIIVLMCSEP